MRILITNDDGVHAEGLSVAERIAAQVDGGNNEVWVVAPASEMSGVGHCISYTSPVRVEELGERRFAVAGTPADCVLVALGEMLADAAPDLVISGVNRGNNSAENTLYSGTVGAAMEAALHGLKAVAMSQFMGPGTQELENRFEAAQDHGAGVIDRLLERGVWQDHDYGAFYNVNFPPFSSAEVRGTKVTSQGFRPECGFKARSYDAPNHRRYYWLTGGKQQIPSQPGSDAHANLEGYISVNPIRADLTDHGLVAALSETFD